jgi:hypothetical protein
VAFQALVRQAQHRVRTTLLFRTCLESYAGVGEDCFPISSGTRASRDFLDQAWFRDLRNQSSKSTDPCRPCLSRCM